MTIIIMLSAITNHHLHGNNWYTSAMYTQPYKNKQHIMAWLIGYTEPYIMKMYTFDMVYKLSWTWYLQPLDIVYTLPWHGIHCTINMLHSASLTCYTHPPWHGIHSPLDMVYTAPGCPEYVKNTDNLYFQLKVAKDRKKGDKIINDRRAPRDTWEMTVCNNHLHNRYFNLKHTADHKLY